MAGWDDLGVLGKHATMVNPYPVSLTDKEIKTSITVNNRAATREAIINAVRKSGKQFYERSQWSLRKNTPNPSDISGSSPKNPRMEYDWDYSMVAIHHAGESAQCSVGFGNMREVEKTHLDKNKWADVGYHYGIDCAGHVYEGTDIRFKGSHLTGYNTGAIGIVLLESLTTAGENGLHYDIANFLRNKQVEIVPDEQLASLKAFIQNLSKYFNIKILGGHREFPKQNRSCPGHLGITVVNTLRNSLKLQAPKK